MLSKETVTVRLGMAEKLMTELRTRGQLDQTQKNVLDGIQLRENGGGKEEVDGLDTQRESGPDSGGFVECSYYSHQAGKRGLKHYVQNCAYLQIVYGYINTDVG